MKKDEKRKVPSYKLINKNENFYLTSNGTLKVKSLNAKLESFDFEIIAIDNAVQAMRSMFLFKLFFSVFKLI